MNELYEKLIRKGTGGAQTEASYAMLLFGGFILFFVYWGFKIPFLFIPAVILGAIGYLIYKKFSGDFKGGGFWMDMIKNNPENIVWIKPITTKHTVGLILTLYKEQKFQILTADDISVTIKCDKSIDSQIFLNGIKIHMPHVQLGFSHQIKSIYKQNPKEFIENLKQQNLYTPISTFQDS
tara:strand:+ start:302 stop:841 length:540 start_codon:yes stop_codon:yes gene_type:complete